MSTPDSLKEAQEKLQALLENAKTGNIIPFRLPGQVEEILDLVQKAKSEQAEAAKSMTPLDMEAYMQDEVYFVGHAIHELRTPMTSIRGYSDMLVNPAMAANAEMQKQFMDVIRTNARRMESLLMDVSHMNKLRKGTLRANKKMELFKNIGMRVEKDMKKVAEELDRQLEVEIPQGMPFVETDSDLLAVALNKLVENGLRYSAKETGRVRMWAEAEGNTLVIIIEDNGIGITPEDREKLGTIYFRSDHDLVREYKGSGLGIPVAFGIFELLGADYQLETAPDVGTRWTIKLQGMS